MDPGDGGGDVSQSRVTEKSGRSADVVRAHNDIF